MVLINERNMRNVTDGVNFKIIKNFLKKKIIKFIIN